MSELNEQFKFEFEKVPVEVNDRLRISRKAGKYEISFINEAGFETVSLPEGTRIEVEPYSVGMGISMPPTEGLVFYFNNSPVYYLIANGKILNSRFDFKYNFQNNEIIKILELPKP